MIALSRRGFLRGLIAAPAVIAAERLMPVRLLNLAPPPLVRNGATLLTADVIAREALLIWEINFPSVMMAEEPRLIIQPYGRPAPPTSQ
jgi:hypothetical protein